MKQLANRPLLLAALLVIPLWIVLGNFIVAAMVALLGAFFTAMVNSLLVLNKKDERRSNKTRDSH